MVLVSSEWQSNKDDEHKPHAAAAEAPPPPPPPPPPAVSAAITGAAAVAVSNGSANVFGPAAQQEATARPGAGVGVEVSKRQQRLNRKAHNKMELSKKAEQEQLLLLREKHENETCELSTESGTINCSDDNDNLENQENNNTNVTETCNSNTNTLQSHLAQQQVQLQMAFNSVLNANNTTTSGNLFSSLGALQLPNEPSAIMINAQDMSPGEAKIVLQCEGKSHKFETRTISLAPNQECKVGRLIAKSKASEGNAIFDCKVLSRNHAMLWYTPDGHFWVKDTKSSNGTFINDSKLGYEPAELHYGDTVKFGVEVIENSRQEVHGCIIARVTLFLPDGREAISIEADQLQLTGPNRISYDEIQRLNGILQEASQREKMLKAKLSNLQGVLDATKKNSAMCWQSMITEDQLLHKINLLEKKLQMMEKNVPENALRNEIVKLLEDKTTYQMTAKEALRKVYQDRCDALQLLSKIEMANTTSNNECGILRAQILSSKQEFDVRLELVQLEYTEYKQETLRQQQEAKEQEEQRICQLKEQLSAQDNEMEQMRQQLMRLQQTIAEHDSEQALQQQQALEQLNAVIAVNDDDDDVDDDNDDGDDEGDHDEGDDEDKEAGDHDIDAAKKNEYHEKERQTTPSKRKSSKKNKRQLKEEFDFKNKVVRYDTLRSWFKTSDLNKGADGGDVLNAIFNNADSGDEEHEPMSPTGQTNKPLATAVEPASDEFIHKSPKHLRLNGIEEVTAATDEESITSQYTIHNKLDTQETLVRTGGYDSADLPDDHAIDMLHEECLFYKKRADTLTNEISVLEEEMKKLKLQQQLQQTVLDKMPQQPRSTSGAEENAERDDLGIEQEPLKSNADSKSSDIDTSYWREELNAMSDVQVEREEELIVYKERLEQSEISNLQLRNEISELRLKQPMAQESQLFYGCILPILFLALAAIIYFFPLRF